MTLAKAITPHLPYLRRYARALTGSQKSGDAYVVSTLEALVAEPTTMRTDLDPRIALFNAFVKIWGTMPANREHEEVGPSGPLTTADRRIETLTPLPRQALLLSAIEGFNSAQIAQILEVDTAEASALTSQAGIEIAQQIAAEVLIIEDEPLIAMDLEEIVTSIGHRIVGIARTHRQAVEMANEYRPGLVLADIQLADGSSGLEAVNQILESMNVPVIFITAYPERLLTGARPEPAFLITKPFVPQMVQAIISQALFFDVKAGDDKEAA